jgi:hypothetical protein
MFKTLYGSLQNTKTFRLCSPINQRSEKYSLCYWPYVPLYVPVLHCFLLVSTYGSFCSVSYIMNSASRHVLVQNQLNDVLSHTEDLMDSIGRFSSHREKTKQCPHDVHTFSNLMFCWPCIIVYQYNETNVMQFLFNLLRIKSLYMFRALLAHPQEALQKRHLVYCVCMSVGCATIAVKLQSCHSQLTLYARNIPSAVFEAPPEDEQLMLETCRGSWFSINWMKIASHWFHYTDILSLVLIHYTTFGTVYNVRTLGHLVILISTWPYPTQILRSLSGNSVQAVAIREPLHIAEYNVIFEGFIEVKLRILVPQHWTWKK